MVGRNRQIRAAFARAHRPVVAGAGSALVRPAVFVVIFVSSAAMASAHPSHLQSIGFADLVGWRDDDHGAALAAFRRSCGEILERGGAFARNPAYGGERADWSDGLPARLAWNQAARQFFESEFVPVRVSDPERPQGCSRGISSLR
jgi:membrane-bound lytic murein transglycosylase A